jgi:glyoxylase-like metal-dependent hydrolase (beta-lactamase superfamily II)
MVLESYRLQEVKEGDEIEDGIRAIDLPGHTRGSMGLLIKTNASTVAIAGDALPNAWSVQTGLPRLIFWDEGSILRTHVMRPTWHFVSPAYIRSLLALTAPRVHVGSAAIYRRLELDDKKRKASRLAGNG